MEIGIELESSSIDTTNFHIKMRYQSTTILNKKKKKKRLHQDPSLLKTSDCENVVRFCCDSRLTH